MLGRNTLFITVFILLSSLQIVAARPPSPIDIAQLLLEGASPEAILQASIEAHTRVEPAYLGIAMHDTRTNRPLNPAEIRELMGPVVQDGAYQLLAMAIELTHTANSSVGLSREQLQNMLDAAFIATLMRPPEHISIEFYDTRIGPSGIGGGPSGRVPEKRYTESKQTDETPESSHDTRKTGDDLILSVLPATERELLVLLSELNIAAPRREGLVALPIITATYDINDIETALIEEQGMFERVFNVQLESVIDTHVTEERPGVYRVIRVGYFSGDSEVIDALEQHTEGVFY